MLGDLQKADKKRNFDARKAKLKAIQGPFVVVNRGDRSGTYNFKHCDVEESGTLWSRNNCS